MRDAGTARRERRACLSSYPSGMSPSRLLALWRRLGGSAAGRWLFAQLIRLGVPYSGSIGARVMAVAPGKSVVTLRDRRRVRNHLQSVHAVALANLAELSSGLAMLAALDPGVRGIPVAITIRYHRKARGLLTATGSASPPDVREPVTAIAHADIHDGRGELVADADVTWQLDTRRGA